MSMSQALDRTAPRSVPCPSSYSPVDADRLDGNAITTCPGCGKHVAAERNYVGPDEWVIEDHQSTRAVDRAIHALAVVVRQQQTGRAPLSPEPDIVDMAHAAELLGAITADPDLVWSLAVKVRARQHAAVCADPDGVVRDGCVCATGEPF